MNVRVTVMVCLLLGAIVTLKAQTSSPGSSCPQEGCGNCQLNNVEVLRSLVRSEVEAEVERRLAITPPPRSAFEGCHQNTSSCALTTLINDNRRLFCSTPSIPENITGFYTLGMSCEYSGGGQLESNSLQRSSATHYFCQCSLLTPSASGFAILSVPSPPTQICTHVVTRCPL